MKLVTMLFALALAAGGVAVAKDGPPTASLATGSAGRADAGEIFRLEANGGGGDCTVEKAGPVVDGRSVLRLGSGCAALYPALAGVAYWRDDASGNVNFTNAAGDAVVAFSISDGLDYESFAPRNPLMALVSLSR